MDDQTPMETGAEIRMYRSPDTVISEATLCAKALGRMVEKTKSFTVISGRKHLHFTAWATLGTMFRLTSRVRSVTPINEDGIRGFECIAEAFHVPSGQVVSVAEAQCTDDEQNWSTRPEYEWSDEAKKRVKVGDVKVPLFQLRSMAQTRACAKALRNVLAWVVVLAGYEATPAEEMTGTEGEAQAGNGYTQPQRSGKASPDDPISEAQVRRIYGLMQHSGKSVEEVGVIVAAFGYSHPDGPEKAFPSIKRKHADAIYSAIQQPKG